MNSSLKIISDITQLIGHTPLIRLNRVIQSSAGTEILAKLESFNPGGSVKDRPCLAMIEDAEKKGILKKGSTVIEPTSGNTGIGLAMICAVRGYNCVLTMPESMSLERIYLLRLYGAKVVLTPRREGIQGAIKKSEELQKKIPGSFIPRQFENETNARAHEETTAREIFEACEGKLDVFVAGVGTGGTITGVGRFLKGKISSVKVVAVEPSASAVLSGKTSGQHNIQGIGAGFIPKILDRGIIDRVIAVSDRDAFKMARRLGHEEGLCVGISGGAAMVAALQLAANSESGKRIVVILPDTGERYFSMEQYFEA